MGLISVLFQEPLMFFMLIFPLLYSVIFHEVAHGWAALLFGDDTARRSGRLSLNPLVHLDPMGTLMLFFAGFGWARPVPVNYYNLSHSRLGLIVVSLAGCAMNIFCATVALLVVQIPFFANNPVFVMIFLIFARINIMLGAFNLIPIPPLDGSKVLMVIAPPGMRQVLRQIEPYGFFILIALLFTGALEPVIMFVQSFILMLVSGILGILS